MASMVTVGASVRIDDGISAQVNSAPSVPAFPVGVGVNGQRQTLSLGSGNTSVVVPPGTKGIFIPSPPVSLTLKGQSTDTGAVLTTSTTNGVPILMPLTAQTLNFANGGSATTVEVIFF